MIFLHFLRINRRKTGRERGLFLGKTLSLNIKQLRVIRHQLRDGGERRKGRRSTGEARGERETSSCFFFGGGVGGDWN